MAPLDATRPARSGDTAFIGSGTLGVGNEDTQHTPSGDDAFSKQLAQHEGEENQTPTVDPADIPPNHFDNLAIDIPDQIPGETDPAYAAATALPVMKRPALED